MWRQLINFTLGIFVAAMAYSEFAEVWVVGIAVLIALIALWAALEEASKNSEPITRHAH